MLSEGPRASPALEVYLAHDRPMEESEKDERLREMVARRGKGEPMAYILGDQEFCGLDVRASRPAVLIPRPRNGVAGREGGGAACREGARRPSTSAPGAARSPSALCQAAPGRPDDGRDGCQRGGARGRAGRTPRQHGVADRDRPSARVQLVGGARGRRRRRSTSLLSNPAVRRPRRRPELVAADVARVRAGDGALHRRPGRTGAQPYAAIAAEAAARLAARRERAVRDRRRRRRSGPRGPPGVRRVWRSRASSSKTRPAYHATSSAKR